ncbi:MAG: type II toxin-antitoxin system VapC family toxin [Patescibacteria group bacterium]
MVKIVPDSSVVVKWVNQQNELNLDQADKLLSDVQAGKVELIVPELAKYELGNALLKKGLSDAQAFQSLGTIYSLPIQFVPETEELAGVAYQMASKVRLTEDTPKFTYYDASFVALAKQEEAVLVTANPKHQIKVIGVRVVPLENYK